MNQLPGLSELAIVPLARTFVRIGTMLLAPLPALKQVRIPGQLAGADAQRPKGRYW